MTGKFRSGARISEGNAMDENFRCARGTHEDFCGRSSVRMAKASMAPLSITMSRVRGRARVPASRVGCVGAEAARREA